MVFDINKFNSHPNKLLIDHINGVVNNVKGVTNSKIAELVAIFHDLGKTNPNFQKKLIGKRYGEYDKHSYLSSYLFFCLSISSQRKIIEEFLGYKLTLNDIVGITTLIAKHHGNIPDFMPENRINNDSGILPKGEKESLIEFVNETDVPTCEFLKTYFIVDSFSDLLKDKRVQFCF
jgi:CRISPR-associated endonuclease Cas3-HD